MVTIQVIERRLLKLADKLLTCEDDKALARHQLEHRVLNLLLSLAIKMPAGSDDDDEEDTPVGRHVEHPSARRARRNGRPVE